PPPQRSVAVSAARRSCDGLHHRTSSGLPHGVRPAGEDQLREDGKNRAAGPSSQLGPRQSGCAAKNDDTIDYAVIMTRTVIAFTMLATATASLADARIVRLRIERRERVLAGRPFGAAGPYEKLVGKIDFALDPDLPRNGAIVDLKLAPRNARGEVEFSADFYLLKPVDPRRGNGRLFYEVGNRGGKSTLATFQKASGSPDPTTEAQFGDGALMRQGFTLLWMGWQWDVPVRDGVMRMQIPIA